MLVLGLSGGLDAIDEQYFSPNPTYSHDSAAVLMEDGRVVAAIENERISRIKHSNKFPIEAINFCLRERGVSLADVDRIAYYWGQDDMDRANFDRFMDYERPRTYRNAKELFAEIFETNFGLNINDKLRFVNHHISHAISAAAQANFDEALVCSIDGMGDTGAGLVAEFRNGELRTLSEIPNNISLGRFYVRAIGFIGYRQFDEYKVMGLAPYGNPERFKDIMKRSYELGPDGRFAAWSPWLSDQELHELTRTSGQPFLKIHQDWAAALQVALEDIVMHVLKHFRDSTGLENLALSGGVAHNCTMNGLLLNSGLFDRVWVQPASHDAGAALGAALQVYYRETGQPVRPEKLEHVYWGTDIGSPETVEKTLLAWNDLVTFERKPDIVNTAAELLAEGAAIGWVQGRSEFGPRALGNRSILADPRPADNKGRINKMIKKREAYRPFAPTVVEERVSEYFIVPENGRSLPFMTFVVDVQPHMRELLGAVTHVDGTARVQTVSKKQNDRYWRLINAFGERTGVPILLNTSFNNNEEPIVDTVEDAIVCFLTTDLDYLVVGDFVISKKGALPDCVGSLVPTLQPYVTTSATTKPGDPAGPKRYHLRTTYDLRKDFEINARLYRIIDCIDGKSSLKKLVHSVAARPGELDDDATLGALIEVWSRRLIRLAPKINGVLTEA